MISISGSPPSTSQLWFDPPCYDTYLPTNNSDRLLPFGLCSGEWLTSVTTYDYLKVPDVPPGEYVLSFRWDCEASAQVWQSCADITITRPAIVEV